VQFSFHSPNLLARPTVLGATGQTWFAANSTVRISANTAVSSGITIIASVSETLETNITPENYAVSITDMEGCGAWVFSEESYYTFQAQYWDGNGYADLDKCQLAFSDSTTWINVSYDRMDNEYEILSGSDKIVLKAGTATVLDDNLFQVTFLIYFKNTILDASDIDLLLRCNDTQGASDGWEVIASNYFNIYALGGHATYESSGAQGYYYVTGFNNTNTDWNTTGASPWLDAVGDGNNINATTHSQDQGWFDFADISGNFMAISMQFYARDISTHGETDIAFTVESSDWGGTVIEPEIGNYWSWYESDLSNEITTEEGVNSLKISIRSWDDPNGTLVIDACRLYVQGFSGRLPGGDAFDLYAYSNGSANYVEANVTFRLLQHIKLRPTFSFNTSDVSARIYFAFDFCINHSWVEGITLRIAPYNIEQGDKRYLSFRVYAQYGISFLDLDLVHVPYVEYIIASDEIYMFHSANASEWSDCTFWVDLWLNNINASTTMGARINSYYYPMQDNAAWWLRWLTGSSWGVIPNATKQFAAFTNIVDALGNVVSTKNIDLVRVRVRLEAAALFSGGTPVAQYVELRNNAVSDLTFSTEPFAGIQTPPWDETRLPTLHQGGFLGSLWSALQRLGAMIVDAYGPSLLGFWNVFVNFLDTIAASFGAPGFFSTLFSWIAQFFTWMVSSVTYLTTLLTTIFTTVLGPTLTKFLNLVASVANQWISMIMMVFSFLDGTFTAGFNVWEELNIASWITVGAILYPMYLIFLWDQKGMEAVIAQITFIKDVIFTLAHFFLAVAQWFVALIGRIIESIPVAE